MTYFKMPKRIYSWFIFISFIFITIAFLIDVFDTYYRILLSLLENSQAGQSMSPFIEIRPIFNVNWIDGGVRCFIGAVIFGGLGNWYCNNKEDCDPTAINWGAGILFVVCYIGTLTLIFLVPT